MPILPRWCRNKYSYWSFLGSFSGVCHSFVTRDLIYSSCTCVCSVCLQPLVAIAACSHFPSLRIWRKASVHQCVIKLWCRGAKKTRNAENDSFLWMGWEFLLERNQNTAPGRDAKTLLPRVVRVSGLSGICWLMCKGKYSAAVHGNVMECYLHQKIDLKETVHPFITHPDFRGGSGNIVSWPFFSFMEWKKSTECVASFPFVKRRQSLDQHQDE